MKSLLIVITALFVGLMLAPQSALIGQSFQYSIIEGGLEYPTAKTADLNNDGAVDLLATDGASIFWYWKRASLITKIVIEEKLTGFFGESSIDVVDLDLDGDNDLVVNVMLPGGLFWYENEQNGQVWTRHVISDNIVYPLKRVDAYGDLDGDGDIDIVSPSYGPPGQILMFENVAGGGAWVKKVIARMNDISWVTIADMDSKDHPEIIASSFFEGTVKVFTNKKDAGWKATAVANLPHCAHGQIEDVDRDGDLDIISHSLMGHQLVWIENPSWEVHSVVTNEGITPAMFVDFNGDEQSDLFFYSNNLMGWLEFLGQQNEWRLKVIDSGGEQRIMPIGIVPLESGEENGVVAVALDLETGIGELRRYSRSVTGIEADLPLADRTWLAENYPDPFNPSTNLRFRIGEAGFAQLTVFDLLGRKVVTLVNEHLAPGVYTKVWDGKNARGEAMSSGIYLYQLKTTGFLETRKMILTK